jgi:hypothetical protein
MASLFSNPLTFIALAALAFFAISFLPGFIAALFEKRMLWPYQRESEFLKPQQGAKDSSANPYSAPAAATAVAVTPYGDATCRRLESMGFSYRGVHYDRRRGIYKLRYDFWLSPDQVVLAMVGGGTLAAIPVSGTTLYTRLDDGRCLVTIDEPKSQDSDPSGLTLQMVVTHADLDTLLSRHRQRLVESGQPAQPYSAQAPLEEHRAFRTSRVEFLIERGLARFLDDERNAWRYTPKGAWTAVSGLYTRELKRQLKEPGRDRVARQGEKGYVPAARGGKRGVGMAIIRQTEFICWMILILGLVIPAGRGGPVNRAQLIFRLAVPAFALATLLVLQIVKRVVIRAAPPAAESTAAGGAGGDRS